MAGLAFRSLPAEDAEFSADAPDLPEPDECYFDDSDGAYAVAEPDPFADAPVTPLRRPSVRAELGSVPAVVISGLVRPGLAPLPVPAGLTGALPLGLRRGSTIAVTGSVSLLLALLGAPSRQGAWSAMLGMPAVSAEAAAEAGIDLRRLAIINPPGGGWSAASWTTAVGALLDAVDVVVARPGVTPIADGDARRLSARARTRDAVLILFGQQAATWPAVQTRLCARHGRWSGIGDGYGRITGRQLIVSVTGRAAAGRARDTELWL
ncbi:hypothetical protein [Jatrophihabitans lederbergiae]|uniref:Uncharacterized protein n=1 Tax=Jatrophihabitans lederbergiae TaxID=3075547 RepID=A0ABU2JFU2_9ACTN|nr:hypothetical protein [Jatrophihabitans sp. DSM 44399]MDT0263797.1 hypothetical protein [Jatrophihabitans sp. DSM 44399]